MAEDGVARQGREPQGAHAAKRETYTHTQILSAELYLYLILCKILGVFGKFLNKNHNKSMISK